MARTPTQRNSNRFSVFSRVVAGTIRDELRVRDGFFAKLFKVAASRVTRYTTRVSRQRSRLHT